MKLSTRTLTKHVVHTLVKSRARDKRRATSMTTRAHHYGFWCHSPRDIHRSSSMHERTISLTPTPTSNDLGGFWFWLSLELAHRHAEPNPHTRQGWPNPLDLVESIFPYALYSRTRYQLPPTAHTDNETVSSHVTGNSAHTSGDLGAVEPRWWALTAHPCAYVEIPVVIHYGLKLSAHNGDRWLYAWGSL